MKIYYAHHTWKYNTPIEIFELDCIIRSFSEVNVVNPNGTIPQDKPEKEIMEAAYEAINDCDALVFSTVSGMIGHGIFNEVVYALNHGIPVYQLVGMKFYPIETIDDFKENVLKDFVFTGNNRVYALVYVPEEYQDMVDCYE